MARKKADQRNADGTFVNGNSVAVGHGRPPKQTEAAYMLATVQSVSLEDWQAIVARAVSDAKAGDASARNWLTKVLLNDGKMSITRVIAMAKTERIGDAEITDEIAEIESNELFRQSMRIF